MALDNLPFFPLELLGCLLATFIKTFTGKVGDSQYRGTLGQSPLLSGSWASLSYLDIEGLGPERPQCPRDSLWTNWT